MDSKYSFFGEIQFKLNWFYAFLIGGALLILGSCNKGHYAYGELDIIQACQGQPSVANCVSARRIDLSSDEKHLLSVHNDKNARLWDLPTRTLVATFGNNTILDAQYTPDGKSMVALTKDKVQILQASDQSLVSETPLCNPLMEPDFDRETSIQFTTGHRVLISSLIYTSNEGCIALIDWTTGAKQFDLAGQQNPVLFANDTQLLTIDAISKVINVWDLTQGMAPVKRFDLGTQEQRFFLSSDEKIVVSLSQTSDQSILQLERWNLATNSRLDTQSVSSMLDLSPDKTRFFASSITDRAAGKIWDANVLFTTGTISEIATLEGFRYPSNPIFFSPNGHDAFTMFLDTYSGSLWHVGWLFDSSNGSPIAGLLSVPYMGSLLNIPRTVVFSADGTQLYVGSGSSYNIDLYDITSL